MPGGIGSFEKLQYQDGILYSVYPWFMLLLFAVSGMSARFYLNSHTCREFVKSKTTKLLVPSTVGLFVFRYSGGASVVSKGTKNENGLLSGDSAA